MANRNAAPSAVISGDDEAIEPLPSHVAIIMDGNNRWARQRNLPALGGHRAGVEQIRSVLSACEDHGISVLTLFAFSSENWQRPTAEVNALMRLFSSYLEKEVDELCERQVRLRVIGARDRFSSKLLSLIDNAERRTVGNQKHTLVIAADYGGQWDIAQAARKLAEQAVAGQMQSSDINAATLQQHLSLADLPEPDMCIRTGGDHRISNFMLWQFAYAELYFTETYWPDFGGQEFTAALRDYSRRQRRFGKRDP